MYGKKYTAQYKIACVEEYLKVKQETGVSIAQFAYDHDIADSTFNDWVVKYRRQGKGFCNITNEIVKLEEVEIMDPKVCIAQATQKDYDDPHKVRIEYNEVAIIFHESLLNKVMRILKEW